MGCRRREIKAYLKEGNRGEVENGGENGLHGADEQTSVHDELGKIRRPERGDKRFKKFFINDRDGRDIRHGAG